MKKVIFFLFFVLVFINVQAQKISSSNGEEVKHNFNLELIKNINIIQEMYDISLKKKHAAIRRYGLDSKETRKAFKYMEVTDDLSKSSCAQIIEEYGFPTYDLVGKEISDQFWKIILRLNSDVELQEKVLELMKQKLPNKTVSMIGVANLTDRCALNRQRPQVYGTQLYYDEETQSYTHHKIENIDALAAKRSQAGLPSLEESIANMNKKYIRDIKSYKDYNKTPQAMNKSNSKEVDVLYVPEGTKHEQ